MDLDSVSKETQKDARRAPGTLMLPLRAALGSESSLIRVANGTHQNLDVAFERIQRGQLCTACAVPAHLLYTHEYHELLQAEKQGFIIVIMSSRGMRIPHDPWYWLYPEQSKVWNRVPVLLVV